MPKHARLKWSSLSELICDEECSMFVCELKEKTMKNAFVECLWDFNLLNERFVSELSKWGPTQMFKK